MDNKPDTTRVERIYVQFCAIGIKLCRMQKSLGIKPHEWSDIVVSFGEGEGLPAKYAKYNDISKIVATYKRLSEWIYEHMVEVNAILDKYEHYSEDEFVEMYRQFKRDEKRDAG